MFLEGMRLICYCYFLEAFLQLIAVAHLTAFQGQFQLDYATSAIADVAYS
jgi:hypothetical protein